MAVRIKGQLRGESPEEQFRLERKRHKLKLAKEYDRIKPQHKDQTFLEFEEFPEEVYY